MHTWKEEQVEAAGRWDADTDEGGGGAEAVWCHLQVYVLKRPYVDEFLQRMGELFECVLFTASLAKVSSRPAKVSRSRGLSVGSRTSSPEVNSRSPVI